MSIRCSYHEHYNRAKEEWWDTPSSFNLSIDKYTYYEKKDMEKKFEDIIDKIISHIDIFPKEKSEINIWKDIAYRYIENLIFNEDFFKLGNSNKDLKNGFFESTKKFIRDARNFDNMLDLEDIGQAMRNVWIINILQELFNEPVRLSKSIYGYSMLYPYTDNYLDDSTISMNEKKSFNERFKRRLQGENIKPLNSYEEQVYTLVRKIEDDYDRETYPEVYESLIQIQNGQINSLKQQDEFTVPYERDILGISIEKGGASVLVDGFIINGIMNTKKIEFCIGYGVFLQLADDLQDVKEDIKNNHITIMSQIAEKYKLDSIANKLINFTINTIDSFSEGNEKDDIKKLIKCNCLNLIIFSIMFSKEYFTKEYIDKLEPYLPFSIKYIENIKAKMRKKFARVHYKGKDELLMILDEMVR